MAARRLLPGAAALALARLALGLGVREAARGAGPPGGPAAQWRAGEAALSVEDGTASGRDPDSWYWDAWSLENASLSPEAVTEDDFDTWYFEHAGLSARDASASGTQQRFVDAGPDKHKADAEQLLAFEQAKQTCQAQVGLENGVITYLVTRKADLFYLKQSVPRLSRHVLERWAYDVKVFVPGDKLREHDHYSFSHSPTLEEVRVAMRKMLGESCNWEIVPFDIEFPRVIWEDPGWQSKKNACANAVSTSYFHMNQFFTKAMYEHPALEKYRFYLRIDADFSFTGDLGEDPFCMMARSGRKFMWQTRKEIANRLCSEGLWEWFEEYQQTHGLSPQDPTFWKAEGATVNYVGYAGMGDLDFFRSERVRSLAQALNEDGRIYLNRWSDQTYYVLLFALFENHSAVGDIGFRWPESAWCHKCSLNETKLG